MLSRWSEKLLGKRPINIANWRHCFHMICAASLVRYLRISKTLDDDPFYIVLKNILL